MCDVTIADDYDADLNDCPACLSDDVAEPHAFWCSRWEDDSQPWPDDVFFGRPITDVHLPEPSREDTPA